MVVTERSLAIGNRIRQKREAVGMSQEITLRTEFSMKSASMRKSLSSSRLRSV